ncbi:MAG: hypothetical protein ACTSP3_07790 [Candidatus Heimdallarchaeaceae archaeon]
MTFLNDSLKNVWLRGYYGIMGAFKVPLIKLIRTIGLFSQIRINILLAGFIDE